MADGGAADFEGVVDLELAVGEGDEAGLVGTWGEVDPEFEGLVEEAAEGVGVAFFGVVEVPDGGFVEVEAEHAADAVEGEGAAEFVADVADTGFEASAGFFETLPAVGFFEFPELGEADGHGERVAGERAGLIDWAVWCEEVHDVGAAAEGTDGETAADDLAHGGEVRGDAADFLIAAAGDAEAGHDLVEDEERAVGGGEGADEFEVAGFGEEEPGVGGNGFDDDGGDLVTGGGEEGFDGFGVVVGEDGGESGKGGGDAGAVWLAVGERTAAGGDEETVDVAVVAAVEFDDAVAPGEAAGEAETGHGGFGAAVAHADLLNGWDPVDDGAGHFDFPWIGDAEAEAEFGGFVDDIDEDVGGVAEDGGAPCADVVDEQAAVDVFDDGTFGATDEERFAADIAEGADGAVDPAGDDLLGRGEQLGGEAHGDG